MDDEFYQHSAVARCLDDLKPFRLLDRPLPSVSVANLLGIVFSHEANTTLRVTVGRLVGTVNKKPVKLPIYNPAVYNISDESYVSGQIVFNQTLNEAIVNGLISHVMQLVQSSDVNGGGTKFNLVDRQVKRCQYENGVKQIKENGRATILRKEHILESMIVYRRDSNLQLKFDVVQTQTHSLREVENDLELMFTKSSDGKYHDSEIKEPEKEVHIMEISLEDDSSMAWEISCELFKGIDDDGEETDVCEIAFGLSPHTLKILSQIPTPTSAREQELNDKLLKGLDTLYIYNALLLFNFDTSNVYPDQGLYYPMIFGDSAADVKRHYNLKKIGLAGESAIEIVRTTNNQVKRLLVDEYVAQRAAVLDLACGHGQDMLKYVEKDPKVFIGIDFSAQEIREARRRALKPSLSQLPFRFHVGNMLLPESYETFLTSNPLFDVVSVQLAIHYTLSSEEAANAILSSIARRLKPGGIFIGSCPSSFAIADRMKRVMTRDENGCIFGNSVYSVTFKLDAMAQYQPQPEFYDPSAPNVVLPGERSVPQWVTEHQHVEPLRSQIVLGMGAEQDRVAHTLIESDPTYYLVNEMWGVPYHFWLIDHIDAVEYVVPWRAFCRVARQHGLTCLLRMPFDEYFVYLKNKSYGEAVRFAGQHDHMMQRSRTGGLQMEVVSIYQVFAFQKDASGVTDPKELAAQPPAQSMVSRIQRV